MKTAARTLSLLFLALLAGSNAPAQKSLKYQASGSSPKVLAVYEAWFGFYKHIDVGYSSHDSKLLESQIDKAKAMGISGFVVDWSGDRNPFTDETYALMQKAASKKGFKVAAMYDQANSEATTTYTINELAILRDKYLAPDSPGRDAYLTFQGRPVIFIFPKGKNTDWTVVRDALDHWSPSPLLIQENRPSSSDPLPFDGYYAWPNAGHEGWKPDGSNWGEDYLADFYTTLVQKHPDKMIVGGAWPQFNDVRAAWSKGRLMSGRCGKTFTDTSSLWRKYVPDDQVIPYLLIATWNDYEEGTDIERGLPTCN